MGLFLQIDIDIFQEQRAVVDPDFTMALHELLDQYYPDHWMATVGWSDGEEMP